jgi:hypothetical protein
MKRHTGDTEFKRRIAKGLPENGMPSEFKRRIAKGLAEGGMPDESMTSRGLDKENSFKRGGHISRRHHHEREHISREHHGWGDIIGKVAQIGLPIAMSLLKKGGRVPSRHAAGGAGKVRKGEMTGKMIDRKGYM